MYQRTAKIVVAIILAVSGFGLSGCYRSSAHDTEADRFALENVPEIKIEPSEQSPRPLPESDYGQEPQYEDLRWPTTNKQLLAIPESQRWYNAAEQVGTNCTIAGPVVNVYQATEANGMPIFVNIGSSYPDSDCVTLLIWAEALDDFEEMLNAVSAGNAWLSVTGYLSAYEGSMQFNISDGPIEYTWWTNVE